MDKTNSHDETDAVTFDEVDFTYGSKPLFEKLSWRVPAGRFVGLLGPNGAGKTTLLNLAAGLLKPSAGSISLF